MVFRPISKGHRKQVWFISAVVVIQLWVLRMLGKCSAAEHGSSLEHNCQTQEHILAT